VNLGPQPSDVNVIQFPWIFRHNENFDGSFKRDKARLEGGDAGQQVGMDYGETFSPVVKPTTTQTILKYFFFKNSFSIFFFLNLRIFVNWISRMSFFMVSLKKQST
jgi:hypothetical protein